MPAPLVKYVTEKSSSDIVIAIKKPEKTPGRIWGQTILKNAYMGVAPRSSAAS